MAVPEKESSTEKSQKSEQTSDRKKHVSNSGILNGQLAAGRETGRNPNLRRTPTKQNGQNKEQTVWEQDGDETSNSHRGTETKKCQTKGVAKLVRTK